MKSASQNERYHGGNVRHRRSPHLSDNERVHHCRRPVAGSDGIKVIAALFMERLYGRTTAVVFTGFILWTSIACMFAATLGYSRIPMRRPSGAIFLRLRLPSPDGNYRLSRYWSSAC
jgi:hypothetical protein